jgi:uncharacterized oxidoreductase
MGWFAELAASQGVITFISGGGAHGKAAHMSVAPHGGASRVMATNPITLGFPVGEQAPVVVDMSTSATAEGKLRFYRDVGRTLPPNWIPGQGWPTQHQRGRFLCRWHDPSCGRSQRLWAGCGR